MAITSTDLQFRLSGGSANSDPDASLGGAISSTALAVTVRATFADGQVDDWTITFRVQHK